MTFIGLNTLAKSKFMKNQRVDVDWKTILHPGDEFAYVYRVVRAFEFVPGKPIKTTGKWQREWSSPWRADGVDNWRTHGVDPNNPAHFYDLGEIFGDDYVSKFDATFLRACGITQEADSER